MLEERLRGTENFNISRIYKQVSEKLFKFGVRRLNTPQQLRTNEARYFPQEAVRTRRSWQESDYWTSIHQQDR